MAKRVKRVGTPLVPMEGILTASFVFGGKRHTVTHKLTEFEVRHMKELCLSHGEEAAQQIVWRGAMKMGQAVMGNCMAQAGLEFVEKHRGQAAVVVEETEVSNVFTAVGLGAQAAKTAEAQTVEEETLKKGTS